MSSPAHHHAGTGSCAQCQLPPDGTEQQRQLEAGEVLWLHEKCEEAFLQRRLAEEGLTGGTAAPSGNGAESGPAITRVTDDDNATSSAALEPNLADINAHLYAIFGPDFVKDHPDSLDRDRDRRPYCRQGQDRTEFGPALSGVRAGESRRLRGADEQAGPQRLCRHGAASGRDRPLGAGDQGQRGHGVARLGRFRQGGRRRQGAGRPEAEGIWRRRR